MSTASKQEKARRQAALAQATIEGHRTGHGDEVAVLCAGCGRPMLCIALPGAGKSYCIDCGAQRFIRRGAP